MQHSIFIASNNSHRMPKENAKACHGKINLWLRKTGALHMAVCKVAAY